MIPTCYLRQRKTYAMISTIMVLTDVVTQQWWYDKAAEIKARPMVETPDRVEPDWGYGEWRDAPIEGEQ